MGMRIYVVDAFTERAFAGNPAAVCLLNEPKPDRWLQDVAREMNLSETAFLLEEQAGYNLRWFTPRVEVNLCGHATLAAAHTLWEQRELIHSESARFHTRSGLLTAYHVDDNIEMDFPSTPPSEVTLPYGLLDAIGAEALYAGVSAYDFIVEVESEEMLRGLKPDFRALRTVTTRGVMVTARGSDEYDFVSRFFAPAVGIDEDPVTGSAHCCLAPYWERKLGKAEFTAFQASARGGILHVRHRNGRVYLRGRAVTSLRGELLV
jgi:PhzF family phenazine biosynthesis protein